MYLQLGARPDPTLSLRDPLLHLGLHPELAHQARAFHHHVPRTPGLTLLKIFFFFFVASISECLFPIFCIYLSLSCLQEMVIVSFFLNIFWLTFPSLFSCLLSWSVVSWEEFFNSQVHPTVSVQDPVSGAFLTPGSEIGFFRVPDLGSGVLNDNFWGKKL